jgi:hypothetical protein
MGKALPILGIIGAVFAALAVMVLVNGAVFVVIPLTLVGSIVLLAQRNVPGAIAGLLVLGLTVLAALGLAGSVTTKKGSSDFGISEEMGRVLAVIACLAVPAAAIGVRWGEAEPAWLAYVGLAGAVLAVILALAGQHHLAEQNHPLTLVAGAVALVPVAGMVGLLRAAPAVQPQEVA